MTEAQEQEALFRRAAYHPVGRLMYATPNDGKRHPLEGAKFKRRGLKPGIPDITLPVPSPNGFHALYIELKRRDRKNKPTADQLKWIYDLNRVGNYACVAYGWDEAWKVIEDYLAGNIAYPK
jgi:hypothetical protein